MPIQYVRGDLFANAHRAAEAFAHGCNCKGSTGAGIAVGFRERYPEMFEQYRALCESSPRRFNPGDCFLYKSADRPWVFNLATQEDYWHSLRHLRRHRDGPDGRRVGRRRGRDVRRAAARRGRQGRLVVEEGQGGHRSASSPTGRGRSSSTRRTSPGRRAVGRIGNPSIWPHGWRGAHPGVMRDGMPIRPTAYASRASAPAWKSITSSSTLAAPATR